MDFFTVQNSQVVVTPEVFERLRDIESLVNAMVASILPTCPPLKISVNDPNAWIEDGVINLSVLVDSGNMRIDQLSWVQQRWLKFIIGICVREDDSYQLWVIDEPERGLQKSLETSISSVLREIQGQMADSPIGMGRVVATHATPFMRSSNLVLVESQPNRSYSRMDGGLYSVATTLGLTAGELLSSYKLLVVVEGLHDEAILSGYYGRLDLDNDGIRIIPSAGVHSWGYYFGYELAFKSIDAEVVFLVDDWPVDQLDRIVREARDIPNLNAKKFRGDVHRKIMQYKPQFDTRNNQADRALLETLCSALDAEESKVRFIGGETKDVLEWLDPKLDFGLDVSWVEFTQSARAAYKLHKRARALENRNPMGFGEFWKQQLELAIQKGALPVGSNPLSPERLEYLASKARSRQPEYVKQIVRTLKTMAGK